MNDLDGYTYEMYEAEQEREKRLRLREQREWEQEDYCGLPFVTVPNDYGAHSSCYYKEEL